MSQRSVCRPRWARHLTLEHFQQKCAAFLRPEMRENKGIGHFRDSGKSGSASGDAARRGAAIVVFAIVLGGEAQALVRPSPDDLPPRRPGHTEVFRLQPCQPSGYEHLLYPSVLRSHDWWPGLPPEAGRGSPAGIEVKATRLLGPMFRCRGPERMDQQASRRAAVLKG